MKTFAITSDHNIVVYDSKKDAEAANPKATFSSIEELAKLAADWPGARLVELWNGIPGMTPVKKFTNRDIAVGRIWRVVQSLGDQAPKEATESGAPAPESARVVPAQAKASKKAKAAKKAARGGKGREGSKKSIIVGLIGREDGATLQQLMKATGWQAHSVRGFISNLVRKAGYKVESVKLESGDRVYVVPAKFRAALQELHKLAQKPVNR